MYLISKANEAVRKAEARFAIVRYAVDSYRLAKIRLTRKEIVDAPPWLQNIELTNRCPLKCVMCPRTESMTRAQGLMDFQLFCSTIDQLSRDAPKHVTRNNLLWLHHFGESLEHPQFADFVNYAAHKRLRPAVSINPIMLTPPIAERVLSSHLDTMLVSLDGHDNQTFQTIRGLKNAYDKSKENLLVFLKLKQERRWECRVFFSMINFSLNAESLDRVRQFWLSQPGIADFQSKPFTSFNGDSDKIVQLGRDLKKKRRKPFVVCDLPWTKMTVTWDGDVVPCCYDYDKKYVLGNLRKNSLWEIWNGPAMRALRTEFNSNDVTNSLCRNCEALRGDYVDEPMPPRGAQIPPLDL